MKQIHKVMVLWLGIITALAGCTTDGKERIELTISAAASTQEALIEIEKLFEEEHPSIDVVYNFGASGALQQQIVQGAPIDVFFSAAEDKFTDVEQRGLLDEQYRTTLVGNELVLIVPKNSSSGIQSFSQITKAERLSIGTPEFVPAGKYAKQTLEHLEIWGDVQEKVVYAKDVRQVLTYVETGNVDAGMVYRTDALMSDKVRIVETAHPQFHDPIVYPLGIVKKTAYRKEAALFYHYLSGQTSIEVFQKYGFKKL